MTNVNEVNSNSNSSCDFSPTSFSVRHMYLQTKKMELSILKFFLDKKKENLFLSKTDFRDLGIKRLATCSLFRLKNTMFISKTHLLKSNKIPLKTY